MSEKDPNPNSEKLEIDLSPERKKDELKNGREEIKNRILGLIDRVVQLAREGIDESAEEMREVRKEMTDQIEKLLAD